METGGHPTAFMRFYRPCHLCNPSVLLTINVASGQDTTVLFGALGAAGQYGKSALMKEPGRWRTTRGGSAKQAIVRAGRGEIAVRWMNVNRNMPGYKALTICATTP